MRHFKVLILSLFVITSCANIPTIKDTVSGKRIEAISSLPNTFDHRVFFAHPDNVFLFEVIAATACEEGYVVTQKKFIKETKTMTWDIECE